MDFKSLSEIARMTTAEKLAETNRMWSRLDTEGKEAVVILVALKVLTGEADMDVVARVFRLAREDGLDAPDIFEDDELTVPDGLDSDDLK